MLIIPAIDLLGGACVRLYQGDYSRSTMYDADPASVARRFEEAGARRIHIVDLDAARGGGDNREVIARIREGVGCTIEVGGGVRQDRDIRALVEIGVDRIVIGTPLVREPALVEEWGREYRNLIAGIDARDGRVRVAGWEEESGLSVEEVAARAVECRLIAIIHTDIARDGTFVGPAIERSRDLAVSTGLPIILSGGIGAMADLERASVHPEIAGVIVGRALYEGKVALAEAIERFQTNEESNGVGW